jgi:hypothetical protein
VGRKSSIDAQAAALAYQPGEVTGGDDPFRWSSWLGRTGVPLRAALPRARHCAQNLSQHENRDSADHGRRTVYGHPGEDDLDAPGS